MSGSSLIKQVLTKTLAADKETRDQMLYYAPAMIIVQILCHARHIVQKILVFIKAKDGDH
jgi:hypothetical protein